MNKWFVERGQRAGRNEAGIEIFKKGGDGAISALIREDIQNSLDAIKDDSKPVKVVLKTRNISGIPDQEGLKTIFNRIKDSELWEHEYDKDIEDIKRKLRQKSISVLKVSDFNTTGAEGASNYSKYDNSSWIALTEINGQTKKDSAGSAGSFGIGKNANMAITPLRTIFFTSKVDTDSIAYSQGKMTYASIVDKKNDITTGNSYFYKMENKNSKTDDSLPIPGEFKEFETLGKRTQSGTDIFIPGVDLNDINYKNIRDAVLDNFLVSIYKGILEVGIDLMGNQYQLISKENLERIVKSSENSNINNYYRAVTQTEKKYVFEMEELTNRHGDLLTNKGDIKFLVFQSDDIKGTRKAMLTRKIGMKINNYPEMGNGFPQGVDFTAVLMVDGDIPNELLHKIENPEHTSWNNKDKFKDSPDAKLLFKRLKEFMRESITKLLPETTDDIPAYGLDSLLLGDESDFTKVDRLPTSISSIEIKKTVKPATRKAAVGYQGKNGNDQGVPASSNVNKPNSGKSGQQRNSVFSGGKGNDAIDVTPYIDSLRSRKVGNSYEISLKSTQEIKHPTLVFGIVGDNRTDTKFQILNAQFVNEKYKSKIVNNTVELLGNEDKFSADELITLTMKFDSDSPISFNIKVLGKRESSDEN